MYAMMIDISSKSSMSVDEFVPWAERQPERWELFDGTPVAMFPLTRRFGDTILANAFSNSTPVSSGLDLGPAPMH
jgi:hypothetical protein